MRKSSMHPEAPTKDITHLVLDLLNEAAGHQSEFSEALDRAQQDEMTAKSNVAQCTHNVLYWTGRADGLRILLEKAGVISAPAPATEVNAPNADLPAASETGRQQLVSDDTIEVVAQAAAEPTKQPHRVRKNRTASSR